MPHLIINGGKKLHGTLENHSAKNSAVALLCATLMIKGKTTLTDVPQIEEVNRIIELLKSVGVRVERKGRTVTVDAGSPLRLEKIDRSACEKTRSSLLLLGALSGRARKYKLYKSGGCKLGNRTVKPHLFALENFGVAVESKPEYYEVTAGPLTAAKVIMYESGDTPTENAIMAAVTAKGRSVIKMASANYMVQDLCYFFSRAGAKIQGIGTTTLVIDGVKELKPVKNYPVMPDPIVAMTYLSAAVTTGSHLLVKNCPLEFLELELYKLEKMGQKFHLKNPHRSENGEFEIVDIEVVPGPLHNLPDKIYGRPFPGLNIDNLPLFVPILAVALGRTLVHDWAYENRAVYYAELVKMGVRVTLLDPHRAWVEGPTRFVPQDLSTPPVLRVAVVLLIAMLAARGKSILRNTYEIDRGYENLYETLNRAGADIKVIKD